ncbi:MAG: sigma 54-interacting transcriptional regulator [Opitutales bacterium]
MAIDKVIVLDDEMIIRRTLEEQLRRRRYSVATASCLDEVNQLLEKDNFDLILADARLPDGSGTELLQRFEGQPDSPLVVIITGFGSIESAVDCMKQGAFDYLIKPFSSDQIDVLLKKAESYSQMVKVNRYYARQALGEGEEGTSAILGRSPQIEKLRSLLKRVANTEATVLVTGENGTGKELVAQELQRLSPLAEQPFIKVNCAAISESLIESEFFGHEKGAFTGATQRREGRFELANNGTILLDEIGEIPPRLQAKLLRVLQEQEFERVGGNRPIKVNVRVIATTNRDLLKEVGAGRFREDLYYRLNVFPVHVPPLRERRADVMLLAEAFLKRCARKHGVNVTSFTRDAAERLCAHVWPGNVRELQNTIERAVILAEDGQPLAADYLGLLAVPQPVPTLREPQPQTAPETQYAYGVPQPTNAEAVTAPAANLPSFVAPAVAPTTPMPAVASVNGTHPEDETPRTPPSLDEVEKDHILNVLEETGGNRTQAANLLKISIRTLRNKLQQYREDGVYVP